MESGEFDEIIDELLRRFENAFKKMEATAKGFHEYVMEDLEDESLRPLTSTYVSTKKIVVTADLPLVEPSSIKVELINPRLLYMEAKIKREVPSQIISYSLPSCTFKYFKTYIDLPFSVNKIDSIKLYREVLEVVLSR